MNFYTFQELLLSLETNCHPARLVWETVSVKGLLVQSDPLFAFLVDDFASNIHLSRGDFGNAGIGRGSRRSHGMQCLIYNMRMDMNRS